MHDNLKLDIFPHIFPQSFFERMKVIAGANPALAASIKRWLNVPVLWDLDARLRMMTRFKGYKQVLTLSLPAIEYLAGPEDSPALARLANDGMAEIVEKLNTEVVRTLKDPETVRELASRGAEASPTTPEAFAKYLREDQERWKKVIKTAGIKLEK